MLTAASYRLPALLDGHGTLLNSTSCAPGAMHAAAPLSRSGRCFKAQKAAPPRCRSTRSCQYSTLQHVFVRCAAVSDSAKAGAAILQPLLKGAATFAAAALLSAAPLPAQAIEMVSPGEATNMAKALPKQEVAKGKVWLVLAGGSAALFGLTVLLENQGRFFPAISKANEAMAISKQQRDISQQGGAADNAIDVEQQAAVEAAAPSIDPVLQGLQSASQRVLGPEAVGGISRAEGAKPAPAAVASHGARPSSSSTADGLADEVAAPSSTYPAVLGAEQDGWVAEHAVHSAGLATWAGFQGSSGSVAFRHQSEQAKGSPATSTSEPPRAAAAAAAVAQLEAQAEPALQTTPQQVDVGAPAGGLTHLADEELEQLIAQKQQAAERAASQQAEEQVAQQQEEPRLKEGSAPLDLSRLSDEDLQRELSKRQLASRVLSDIANAD